MAWVAIDFETESGKELTVFPYEDWERLTRPDVAQGPSGVPMWKPLFVALSEDTDGSGTYIKSAMKVSDLIVCQKILAGAETRRNLEILKNPTTFVNYDHSVLSRVFIYRTEQEAKKEAIFPDGSLVYTTVHVSATVPQSFLNSRPIPTPTPPTTLNEINNQIVLTAVIDDSMGVANQRFRSEKEKTRIQWYWNQGLEGFYAGARDSHVVIGREFEKADIDGLLDLSENAFYTELLERRATRLLLEILSYIEIWIEGYNEAADKEKYISENKQELLDLVSKLNDLYPLPEYQSLAGGDFGTFLSTLQGKIGGLSAAFKFYSRDYERPLGNHGAHGTAMIDIAAGFDLESGHEKRPIAAVELPGLATLETSGARLDAYVLQGVQRILHWADNFPVDGSATAFCRVPVVINFSYGISAGPKNGQGFLEREIQALVDHRNNKVQTVAVLPAGNTYRSALSGQAEIPAHSGRTVEWPVQAQDFSPSYLEVRVKNAHAEWDLTLTTPQGETRTFSHTDFVDQYFVECSGTLYSKAVYVKPEPETGSILITIALAPTLNFEKPRHKAEPGVYKVTLKNTGASAFEARYDVQRDDTPVGYPTLGRQSYLDDEHVDEIDEITKARRWPGDDSVVKVEETLNAFAGDNDAPMFLVGGTFPDNNRLTNTDKDVREPTRYTSSGINPRRPDISAISEQGRAIEGVMAAGTFSGSVVAISGTSAAAPQATRAIVDYLLKYPCATPYNKDALLAGVLSGVAEERDPRTGFGTLEPDIATERAGRKPRRLSDPVV